MTRAHFVRGMWLALAASCLLSALAGCDINALASRMAPAADQQVALQVFDDLRAGRFAQVEARLDPSLRTPGIRSVLQQMAAQFPQGGTPAVALAAWNKHIGSDGTRTLIQNEYSFPGRWLVGEVVLRSGGGAIRIVGLHVYPLAQSLEAANAFTLRGKGAAHFLMLAGIVAAPLLSLYALVACVRIRGMRRKKRWLAWIAVGVMTLGLDWNTGAWSLQPFSLQLLSAGFARAGLLGPWSLGLSVPLGAIMFLSMRREIAAKAAVASAPVAGAAPDA